MSRHAGRQVDECRWDRVTRRRQILKRTIMWRPFIVDLWDTRLRSRWSSGITRAMVTRKSCETSAERHPRGDRSCRPGLCGLLAGAACNGGSVETLHTAPCGSARRSTGGWRDGHRWRGCRCSVPFVGLKPLERAGITAVAGLAGDVRARSEIKVASLGVEAPGRPDVRSAHTGSMEATSNAGGRDASAARWHLYS